MTSQRASTTDQDFEERSSLGTYSELTPFDCSDHMYPVSSPQSKRKQLIPKIPKLPGDQLKGLSSNSDLKEERKEGKYLSDGIIPPPLPPPKRSRSNSFDSNMNRLPLDFGVHQSLGSSLASTPRASPHPCSISQPNKIRLDLLDSLFEQISAGDLTKVYHSLAHLCDHSVIFRALNFLPGTMVSSPPISSNMHGLFVFWVALLVLHPDGVIKVLERRTAAPTTTKTSTSFSSPSSPQRSPSRKHRKAKTRTGTPPVPSGPNNNLNLNGPPPTQDNSFVTLEYIVKFSGTLLSKKSLQEAFYDLFYHINLFHLPFVENYPLGFNPPAVACSSPVFTNHIHHVIPAPSTHPNLTYFHHLDASFDFLTSLIVDYVFSQKMIMMSPIGFVNMMPSHSIPVPTPSILITPSMNVKLPPPIATSPSYLPPRVPASSPLVFNAVTPMSNGQMMAHSPSAHQYSPYNECGYYHSVPEYSAISAPGHPPLHPPHFPAYHYSPHSTPIANVCTPMSHHQPQGPQYSSYQHQATEIKPDYSSHSSDCNYIFEISIKYSSLLNKIMEWKIELLASDSHPIPY
jgi:hypothetical protein